MPKIFVRSTWSRPVTSEEVRLFASYINRKIRDGVCSSIIDMTTEPEWTYTRYWSSQEAFDQHIADMAAIADLPEVKFEILPLPLLDDIQRT